MIDIVSEQTMLIATEKYKETDTWNLKYSINLCKVDKHQLLLRYSKIIMLLQLSWNM